MDVNMKDRTTKPLGTKAYGSIGHLPNSRMGPADHKVTDGQARIATVKARDKHDRVYVQEKLDGSCVAVAKIEGQLVPLGRAGYPALSSPYEMHQHFHYWAMLNFARFDELLRDGERAVGEWLMQAHGTKYDLSGREPFVLFDIMREGHVRVLVEELKDRGKAFAMPHEIANEPITVEAAMQALGEYGRYGAEEPVEGCVWRVERQGKVDFLCKYVRPDKVDGCCLKGEPVWNVTLNELAKAKDAPREEA